VIYKIKQFFKRIYNLYRWFPIIWKDQDWDHHYIFEILKFKLKNQANYIGGKDRHTRAKRDAEIIMTCIRLINKVQDEYYGREYFEYHKSELKFIPSESHPGSYEIEIEHISDNYEDYFKKYPLIYRMVPDLKASKHKIALDIARINEERAHKLLFKILEQNIRNWWD
jgi:hypothetical protein